MTGRAAWCTVALAVLLAGCTADASDGPSSPVVTRTHIVRTTLTPPPPVSTYHPPPAATVTPLPPDASTPKDEKQRRCPYIKTGLDQDGYHLRAPNVADIEGDRVYRTTVLTRDRPVGCRFYFYAPPYEAIADIVPRRFPTAADAHNALVLTAEAGSQPISAPDFVPGVDGISYRTKFFGEDGAQDWAFAFAKGRVLVVVHTQRSDTSRTALYLARAVVTKF